LGDDDHTQYHNDARAATWLAAGHETNYAHTLIPPNDGDLGDVLAWFGPPGGPYGPVWVDLNLPGFGTLNANEVVCTDVGGAIISTSKLIYNGTDFTLATGSSLIGTDFTPGNILYANATKEITASSQIQIGATRPTLPNGMNCGFSYVSPNQDAFIAGLWIPRNGDLTNLFVHDYQDEFAYLVEKGGTITISPAPDINPTNDYRLFHDDSYYVGWTAATSPGTDITLEVIPGTAITNKGNAYFNVGITFRAIASFITHIKIEMWDTTAGEYATVYNADVSIAKAAEQWVSARCLAPSTSSYNVVKLKITITVPKPLPSVFRIQRVMLYHSTCAWDPWHIRIGGDTFYGDVTWIDNKAARFGTGNDATILYDGTNLIINPKAVGSGILDVAGTLQVDGYNSADGTAGVTANVATLKSDLGTRTLHFKNGLYTGYTDS
jgi:hypothetical protein